MTASSADEARPLSRDRTFVAYQVVRLLVVVAIQMTSLAVAWVVYERTPEGTSPGIGLGFVGLAQFAPPLLLAPITGAVADRFDRRIVLCIAYTAFAVCSAVLAWLASRPDLGQDPIYVVLVAIGVARAFSGPSAQALLPSLVPRAQLSRAVAVASTVFQGGTIAGPALGGQVLALHDAVAVLSIAAGSALLGAALMTTLRFRTESAPPTSNSFTLEHFLAGVRFVRSRPVILGAISLDLFAVLLGGAVALMPVFADEILHQGKEAMGPLRFAPAVGAGGMALFLAFRPIRGRAGPVLFAAVATFGVATLVFGLSTSYPLSLAALAVLGAADMISVVIRQTVVQVATPPEMRGRVAAVNQVFIGASNELGEAESGFTTALFGGVVPAVVFGGLGTLFVTMLWSRLFPALRHVDRLEDEQVRT